MSSGNSPQAKDCPPVPRVAIVTGAAGGIGQAVCPALYRAGWSIVLAGRRLENLNVLARLCRPQGIVAGQELLCVDADVTKPTDVERLMQAAEHRFGRVDLLFNNAGINAPALPIEELPVEEWQRLLDTNLSGMFLCMRAAFAQMKRQTPQGGRIINNGSVSAQVPRPDSFAYTATKAAVNGLTRCGALDGRKYNIAVGQIDIGNALTDMAERMTRGVQQADGTTAVEPVMDVGHVADAIVHMAGLPLNANIFHMTLMATGMPLVGRG